VFSATVQLEAEHAGWMAIRTVNATATNPRYERLGVHHIVVGPLALAAGERIAMSLLRGTWSFSPGSGRGVDDWPAVLADVYQVSAPSHVDLALAVAPFICDLPPPSHPYQCFL